MLPAIETSKLPLDTLAHASVNAFLNEMIGADQLQEMCKAVVVMNEEHA
jgi:hypothetical protein